MANTELKAIREILKVAKTLRTELGKTEKSIIKISQEAKKAQKSFKFTGPKKVNAEIEKNTEVVRKLNKQLVAQELANKKLQTQMLKMQQTRKKGNTLTIADKENKRALTAQMKLLHRSSDKLASAYSRQSAKLILLRNRYKHLASQQQMGIKLSKRERAEKDRLIGKIQRLDGALKKVDRTVGQSQRNVGNYRSALGGLGSSLRNLAGAFGLMGGVMIFAQMMRSSIKTIIEFDKANATLASVLQLTREQTKGLQDDSKRLGATTVKSANEVVQLQIAYARLGFSQKEIINLTEATIEGSIAMNSELAETATLTGAVINSMDEFSTIDAPEVLDIMALATAKSALSFEKLNGALPVVLGAANAVNVPFTKVVATLGKLTDAGIDASSGATALRNIFIESAKRGIDYEVALDKIRVSQDKLKTANELFGKRAAVSALIIAKNVTTVEELDEALQNAAGTSKEMADKELDTLHGAIKLLESAWSGLILKQNEEGSIAETLKTILQGLAKNLENIVKFVVIATKVWLGYKAVLILARIQQLAINKQLLLSRKAAVASARGVKVASVAWGNFNKVLRANALGIAVIALTVLVGWMNKLQASTSEVVKHLTDMTGELALQAETSVALNKNLKTMSDRYVELTEKTELNKDEQKELDKIIKMLAKHVPDAVTEVDLYGDALVLNTKKVGEFIEVSGELTKQLAETGIEEMTVQVDKMQRSVDYMGKAFSSSGDSVARTNGIFVEGIGIVRKENGQYVHRNKVLKTSTKLTVKQGAILKKHIKTLEDNLAAGKKDIENNEDIITSITGIMNARQKAAAERKKENEEKKIEEEVLDAVLVALRGSIKAYQDEISVLKKLQSYTATTSAEFEAFSEKIGILEHNISELNGSYEKFLGTIKDGDISLDDVLAAPKESDSDFGFVDIEGDESIQDYEDYLDTMERMREQHDDRMEEHIQGTFDRIGERYGIDLGQYKDYLKLKREDFDSNEEYELAKKLQTIDIVSNALTAAMTFAANAQRQAMQEQFNRLEEQKQTVLSNAELTENQRFVIEAEFARKKNALKVKQFKQEQKMAVVMALINGASAVVKTFATLGFPAGIVGAAIIAGLTAVEVGIIKSQSAPEFKDGHLAGTYEGIAKINDGPGKSFQEIVERKDGRLQMFKNRDEIITMQKGDKVHKAGTFTSSNSIGDGMAIGENSNGLALNYTPEGNISISVGAEVSKEIKQGFKGLRPHQQKEFNYKRFASEMYILNRANSI
tara:strand:- start:33325 stop:37065 length:3741 start_codon:yes stop_codon:yes gene_type:complete